MRSGERKEDREKKRAEIGDSDGINIGREEIDRESTKRRRR